MDYSHREILCSTIHHVEYSQKWKQCSCYIDKLKRAPEKQDAVSIKNYM